MTGSLRERGKARRYAEIVAAAAGLWREHGFENVSLSQIAAAAQVAPQTIYNLIGGLDAVGLAVINVAMDRVEAALADTAATGVALALEAARVSAQLYIDDARLYRQVLVRIPRVLFDGTHIGRDAADPAVRAMLQAQAAGEIAPEVDADRLGRVIYSNYLGAIYDWACGDSTDAEFLETSQIGVLAPVVACATDAARPALSARLFALLGAKSDAPCPLTA
ncbi:TetR/AcrR family transcriptional regulator [Caulobacter segnis]|uniref:TetR/AcrR family transcriptional regulator n=1 Tax=Caulobacter segnis TaxID=88688 RepID=UPI001CC131FC|nr:TetR/AcrR family transcriptional regulator [Caulobacter segnis]